mmetsp:Transcript_72990/g.148168  ORF Transcript_72990/g.148168 Transcript_72990/m.148168 type:complete len:286 (+) Transcript_72990:191-1048(+)
MGADAVFVGLTIDHQGGAIDVPVLVDLAPIGGGFLPVEIGQLLFTTGTDQLRFDPVGPVTAVAVPAVRDDEKQLLGPFQVDLDIDLMSWSGTGDHGTLIQRFHVLRNLVGRLLGFLLLRLRLRLGNQAFHVVTRQRDRLDTVLRNFFVTDPHDGVENHFAEVWVSPVPVEVTTGETKATATIFTLGSPGNVLWLPLHRADMLITAVRTIRSAQGAFWWSRGQNRSDADHVVAKPHVVVPLVVDLEWLDTLGDWVIRQLLERRGPVWIHAPPGFKVTTNPIDELIT